MGMILLYITLYAVSLFSLVLSSFLASCSFPKSLSPPHIKMMYQNTQT